MRYGYLEAMVDLFGPAIGKGCDPEDDDEFGSCCLPDAGETKLYARCCADYGVLAGAGSDSLCVACPAGRSNDAAANKRDESTCVTLLRFSCKGDIGELEDAGLLERTVQSIKAEIASACGVSEGVMALYLPDDKGALEQECGSASSPSRCLVAAASRLSPTLFQPVS